MNNKNLSPVNVAGILAGVIILIIGIFTLINSSNNYHSTNLSGASFGGDFYTYAYDGIRGVDKTVNGMWTDMDKQISKGIGAIVSVAGVMLIFICAANLERYKQNEELIAALQKINSQGEYSTNLQTKSGPNNNLPPM